MANGGEEISSGDHVPEDVIWEVIKGNRRRDGCGNPLYASRESQLPLDGQQSTLI